MHASDMQLREAQAQILQYDGGRLAVSAVPGSGKTYTLSLLAAQLIAKGIIDVAAGQQVLIVTYLNASVETFKARIRQRLQALDLPNVGFDVRTLHSLGLEIARTAGGALGDEFIVLDQVQADYYLNRAVNNWIEHHPHIWHEFLPAEDTLQMRTRWRSVTERTARTLIRTAKNERLRPERIQSRLQQVHDNLAMTEHANIPQDDSLIRAAAAGYPLLTVLVGIYSYYQSMLRRQGAMDYDDLIWRATDLLEGSPDLAQALAQRWPYVLEDEAQDSVPLQESLLANLTSTTDNWVRVGDPNQAVTSSFTAAHPRYFNSFLDREDVLAKTLPVSGRSAPRIIGAANTLVHWTAQHHPVPEVRRDAFRVQDIVPSPAGDAQQNPEDTADNMRIKVYGHREQEELPAIAQLAQRYIGSRPQHTVAILVPTNRVGHAMSEQLDRLQIDYDNLLRGGSREREIASAMHALLSLLANPLDTSSLINAHRALSELKHPVLIAQDDSQTVLHESGPQYAYAYNFESGTPQVDVTPRSVTAPGKPVEVPPEERERVYAILRSVRRPEALLFPRADESMEAALPAGVATDTDLKRLRVYLAFIRGLFSMRSLAPEDLVVALSNELFTYPEGSNGSHDGDLAIAYQIGTMIRRWRDLQPGWRLPEIVAQLDDLASGKRPLPAVAPLDIGFEPTPGRVTLATQHSAKGLEWDAVFLVGIDGFWIPDHLRAPFLGVSDFLGGDPAAEATAQLRELMHDSADLYVGRTPTEAAHIEVINERLRLLYVGITRARRYLHLSRSRLTRYYQRERETVASRALGVIYDYLRSDQPDTESGGTA